MDIFCKIKYNKKESPMNIKATLQNNILEFNLENMNTIIDIDNQTFKRINDEYLFFLDLKNKQCYIKLIKEQITLPIMVEESDFNHFQSIINIKYKIETDDDIFELKIEMSEENVRTITN